MYILGQLGRKHTRATFPHLAASFFPEVFISEMWLEFDQQCKVRVKEGKIFAYSHFHANGP